MSYNSDIDISTFKVADINILKKIKMEFFNKYNHIPTHFSWGIIDSTDSDEIKRKKKLISPVKNQYLCGCCWAISCATAISDAYVIRGIVDWAPNISYTYALSTYPQQKCVGGSSRILLEEIKNGHGIASDYCVDESWCLNDENCVTADSSKHFSNKNKEYLSSLIPPEGCYDGTKKHYIYFVDDVYSLTVNENLKISETQTYMKQHIMVRGPLIGGFVMLENFPNGNFTKSEHGIYLENYTYDIESKKLVEYKNDKIIGSHSVVIMGWGITSNVLYKNRKTDIPYWICKNSWGVEWGNEGYFKIAMYPYNKICQFTKRIKVIHKNVVKDVGGVTGFLVVRYPELKNIKSNNTNYTILKNPLNYYQIDENLIIGNKFLKNIKKEDFAIVFVALTFAVILIFFK